MEVLNILINYSTWKELDEEIEIKYGVSHPPNFTEPNTITHE
jgi:hypothetical protein